MSGVVILRIFPSMSSGTIVRYVPLSFIALELGYNCAGLMNTGFTLTELKFIPELVFSAARSAQAVVFQYA
jgi:hypothetical protein